MIARGARRVTLSSLGPHIPSIHEQDDGRTNSDKAMIHTTNTSASLYLTGTHSDAVDSSRLKVGSPEPVSSSHEYANLMSNINRDDVHGKRNHSKRVILNVGGQRHEVLWSTLERIPNTRLGQLRQCVTHESLIAICDDYDIANNEYFFDRHPTAFSTVIDFYRTGKLHLMDDICIMSITDELEFWGIDEYYLEQCCLTKFNQRRDNMMEEMRKDKECLHGEEVEYFGEGRYNRARKFVWDLLEKPDSSKPAKVSKLIL